MSETSPHLTPGVEKAKAVATTVRLMEKLHAEELFATPEDAKNSLDAMTFEQFERLVDQINGIERGVSKEKRGMHGGSNIVMNIGDVSSSIEYVPPIDSARRGLVQEAFMHAKDLESPQEAGLMLGMVINAVHPYKDGNGRVSRLLCGLLSEGYDGTDESKAYFSNILQNTEGRKVIQTNPSAARMDEMITWYSRQSIAHDKEFEADEPVPTYIFGGYDSRYENIGIDVRTSQDLELSKDVSPESRDKLFDTLVDRKFAINALLRAVPKSRIQSTSRRIDSRVFVEGSKLFPTLTEEQIEAIHSAAIEEKNSYIRALIHMFDDERYAKYSKTLIR